MHADVRGIACRMAMDEVLCLRDGEDTLVISGGLAGCFHLPPRCVVCNAEAPTGRIRKTFRRRSLVALTPVMGASAGYDMEIEFSICRRHKLRRLRLLALGVLAFVAGISVAALDGMLAYLIGVVMIVGAGILIVMQSRVVRLLEIDAVQAKIRVGKPFAQSFAEDLM
jgi:hypothetical protein